MALSIRGPRSSSASAARSLTALFSTLFFVSAPAGAFEITGLGVALGASNTAGELNNSGNNRAQIGSATSIVLAPGGPVADTPGSMIEFTTRYASILAVDREGTGGGTTSRNATAHYQITFTVENPTGGDYQLEIDTSRLGALTNVDDDAGTSTQTLGTVSGTLDAAAEAAFSLSAVGPFSTGSSGTSPFSQIGSTLTILESAVSRTYVLGFTWTASATSNKDEAAIRMGIAGGLGTTTADDYPGLGGRTAADDGHFVDVKATFLAVPEPATGALLSLGLVGLAIGGRRRS